MNNLIFELLHIEERPMLTLGLVQILPPKVDHAGGDKTRRDQLLPLHLIVEYLFRRCLVQVELALSILVEQVLAYKLVNIAYRFLRPEGALDDVAIREFDPDVGSGVAGLLHDSLQLLEPLVLELVLLLLLSNELHGGEVVLRRLQLFLVHLHVGHFLRLLLVNPEKEVLEPLLVGHGVEDLDVFVGDLALQLRLPVPPDLVDHIDDLGRVVLVLLLLAGPHRLGKVVARVVGLRGLGRVELGRNHDSSQLGDVGVELVERALDQLLVVELEADRGLVADVEAHLDEELDGEGVSHDLLLH
uniref:Uncharacterized protein n=1 Tax=Strombidium rassoulzadegani TaxID=1082188 RepID=A0A7S3CQ51_9SPIT